MGTKTVKMTHLNRHLRLQDQLLGRLHHALRHVGKHFGMHDAAFLSIAARAHSARILSR